MIASNNINNSHNNVNRFHESNPIRIKRGTSHISRQSSNSAFFSAPPSSPSSSSPSTSNEIHVLLLELHSALCQRVLFDEIQIFKNQQQSLLATIQIQQQKENEGGKKSGFCDLHNPSSLCSSSSSSTPTDTCDNEHEHGSSILSKKKRPLGYNKRQISDASHASHQSQYGNSTCTSNNKDNNHNKRPRSKSEHYTTTTTTQPVHNPTNSMSASSIENSNNNNNINGSNNNIDHHGHYRTWTDIVQDLSSLVSFMTEVEYHLSCKLISICLLSYFQPHYSLRDVFCRTNVAVATPPVATVPTTSNTNNYPTNNTDYNNHGNSIRNLKLDSLEQIIKQCTNGSSSGSSGTNASVPHVLLSSIQHNSFVIQHEQLYKSFWNFMYNALRPFLASRALLLPVEGTKAETFVEGSGGRRRGGGEGEIVTESSEDDDYDYGFTYDNDIDRKKTKCNKSMVDYNTGTEDLLHVLAMAISPEIHPKILRELLSQHPAASDNDESKMDINNDNGDTLLSSFLSKRARHFISNKQPLYFDLSYKQRCDIIYVLTQSLVLSDATPSSSTTGDGNHLYNAVMGGIIHLRASIQMFTLSSSYCSGLSFHLRSPGAKNSTLTKAKKDARTSSPPSSNLLSSMFRHQDDSILIQIKRLTSNIAIDTGTFVIDELKSLIESLITSTSTSASSDGVDKSTTNCSHCRCLTQRGLDSKRRRRVEDRNVMQQRFILSNPTMSKSRLVYQQQLEQERQQHSSPVTLCLQCETGTILKELILRYNGARHYADVTFTRQALAELTGAIATILGKMAAKSHLNPSTEDDPLSSSCVVSSLLDAATSLFYFLQNHRPIDPPATGTGESEASHSEVDENQLLENGMKEALFQCAIQLMNSPNECIVSKASSLLALALAYKCDGSRNQEQVIQSSILNIHQTVQTQFKRVDHLWKYDAFCDIIKVSSRLSYSFAYSISSSLIEGITAVKPNADSDKNANDVVEKNEYILSLVSSIAQMQPQAILKKLDQLLKVFSLSEDNSNGNSGTSMELSEKCKSQLISIILSCRLAQLLPPENWSMVYKEHVRNLVLSLSDGWTLYLLTRHAFSTGNFDIAAEEILQKRLLNEMSTSSKSYLWYTTLLMIARAESELSKEGTTMIPHALISLDAAINSLGSIGTTASTAFLNDLLCRRKDFLQLCLIARGMCAEMRLTNSEGDRHSRTRGQQRNISRCFYMVGSQYAKINKEYGAIHCQQTRSSIRSIFALCHFMGDAVRKVFYQVSQGSTNELHKDRSSMWPKGDNNHVLSKFLARLRRELIEPLDQSVEPKTRAESLIEIIDIICKCPFPYPRDFMSLKTLPPIEVCISPEPTFIPTTNSLEEKAKESGTATLSMHEIIEVQPGSTFNMFVSGVLPEAYFKQGYLSCSQIVVYRSLVYDGPLSGIEDVDENGENHADMLVDKSRSDPSTEFPSELLPSCECVNMSPAVMVGSKFMIPVSCEPILSEGYYFLEIKLFLRDVRGGEYRIPIVEDCDVMIVMCKSH